jgi:hypothetical protein
MICKATFQSLNQKDLEVAVVIVRWSVPASRSLGRLACL